MDFRRAARCGLLEEPNNSKARSSRRPVRRGCARVRSTGPRGRAAIPRYLPADHPRVWPDPRPRPAASSGRYSPYCRASAASREASWKRRRSRASCRRHPPRCRSARLPGAAVPRSASSDRTSMKKARIVPPFTSFGRRLRLRLPKQLVQEFLGDLELQARRDPGSFARSRISDRSRCSGSAR